MSDLPHSLDDEFDDPALSSLSGHEEGGQKWLISYADVITLLLCFFVLFFNEKPKEQDKPNNVIDSIRLTFKGKEKRAKELSKSVTSKAAQISAPANAGEGGTGTGIIDKAFQQLSSLPSVKVVRNEGQLIIDFAEGNFYNIGAYELNANGRDHVNQVALALKPFVDKVNIQIQGHTDSLTIAPRPGRLYKSNMELSALRALGAYKMLASEGFPATMLSISGFADHRSNRKITPDEWGFGMDRRVSFLIEAK